MTTGLMGLIPIAIRAATFWVLGYSATGSVAVSAMFFALSFARAYALRVLFRNLEAKL